MTCRTAAAIPLACLLASPGVFGQTSRTGQVAPPRNRPATTVETPGTARISGRVVAADTGLPVRRARVVVASRAGSEPSVAQTDDNGAFELGSLAAGQYMLTVSKPGYITISYGQRRPQQPPTPIQIEDRQHFRDANVLLPRGGVIAGRVLDEDSGPLPLASVTVLRSVYRDGERQLAPAGFDQTDDRGEYRIFGLEPGEYVVSASVADRLPAPFGGGPGPGIPGALVRGVARLAGGRPDGARPRDGRSVAGTDTPDEPSVGYAPTYYPGVSSVAEALRVSLGLSEEIVGVDFSVRLVPTARVSGIVHGPDGAPAGPVQLVLMPADRMLMLPQQRLVSSVGPDGRFEVRDVPPGRYVLRAQARGFRRTPDSLFAAQEIVVDGRPVPGLTLILAPGAQLSGQVRFEGNRAPAAGEVSRMRVSVQTLDPFAGGGLFGGASTARVNDDGTFVLSGLAPGGPFLIRPVGPGDGWSLKAVYLEGRDVTDTGLHLPAGERATGLEVVLTDRISSLTGIVQDHRGQPLTDFVVIAFSADPDRWRPRSRYIQASRPDQHARYQIRALPAGEYLLTASDAVQQGEWYDPLFLERLRAVAVRVTLREGESKSLDLTLGDP